MYSLRPYQADCVQATLDYFRRCNKPAVLVLPTGAGKSLVIAALAKLAKGRVLVLTHVKELVEQNHDKYESYGLHAGIFSAGLGRKDTQQKVVFASVQSMVNNLDDFTQQFSLLVIDECHRVPDDEDSSYQKVIAHLQTNNPKLKILGLTATPYRLGMGWIYRYHSRGMTRSEDARFFHECIFELPINYLLEEGFLCPARLLDMATLSYDFSSLRPTCAGHYRDNEINQVLSQAKRATPLIIQQVIEYAQQRHGVMIFAATVDHAKEILGYLPSENSALIIGDTPAEQRTNIIQQFKSKQLKFLVNVSVLTTGFDAPHVDLIAILRPTESVSLYQQIIGRGLRLSPQKKDCLVLEYAGNHFDLYQPEVGQAKPNSDSEIVTIPCPACGFNNNFWGKLDSNGLLLEHYGRRCQGFMDDEEGEREDCGYRFKAKYCDECGADNDIAARRCHQCQAVLVDPDKKLRDALKLKDALVMQVSEMQISASKNQYDKPQLKVTYRSSDDAEISEVWPLANKGQKQRFLSHFIPPHLVDKHRPFIDTAASKITQQQHRFRPPEIIVARKQGRFWKIQHKLFDLADYPLSDNMP